MYNSATGGGSASDFPTAINLETKRLVVETFCDKYYYTTSKVLLLNKVQYKELYYKHTTNVLVLI